MNEVNEKSPKQLVNLLNWNVHDEGRFRNPITPVGIFVRRGTAKRGSEIRYRIRQKQRNRVFGSKTHLSRNGWREISNVSIQDKNFLICINDVISETSLPFCFSIIWDGSHLAERKASIRIFVWDILYGSILLLHFSVISNDFLIFIFFSVLPFYMDIQIDSNFYYSLMPLLQLKVILFFLEQWNTKIF